MRLGFLGFGEAGFCLAKGLRDAGLNGILAYDCNYLHPVMGKKIGARAEESGIRLLASGAELAAQADVILSVVTASSALAAAQEMAAFLDSGKLYCDCNSVSPATKRQIAAAISSANCTFVEAAIMAPVQPYGHKVPIILNGGRAAALAEMLRPLGMRLSLVQGEPGSAAAIKMCRSIVVKGMEALLLECSLAARHFHCEAAVFSSLNETFPAMDWQKTADYMAERVLQHGARRAAEMREVASMQREAGLAPMMSLATAEVQDWRARLAIDDLFDGPEDFLAALASRTETKR